MDNSIIYAISNAGFDVYMRNKDDSYCIFTSGNKLGYLQYSGVSGIDLSTVHKPNTQTGTGFHIEDGLTIHSLTRTKLEQAFINTPTWYKEVLPIKKWSNIEEYKNSDSFNAGLQLVKTGNVP